MENNKKTKLKTRTRTMLIMFMSNLVCKVWWNVRCKFRGIDDFDYYITDLRCQYPNELAYHSQVASLPFFCKTLEVDDSFEKTWSIKIGDCNIQYTFDKIVRLSEQSSSVDEEEYLQPLYGSAYDPRVGEIANLIKQTRIRHNEPSKLRVLQFRKEKDVVELYRK